MSQPRQRMDWSTIRENFGFTLRTIALTWGLARRMTVLLAGLTVVAAVLPIGIVYVGKMIVDAVVSADASAAWHLVAIELALVAVQAGLGRSLALTRQLLASRLSVDINLLIVEKARSLELSHFENPAFYDQLRQARQEASSRPVAVISSSFELLQNTVTLVGYIGLLFQYSAWAVVGLFLAALPGALAEVHFSGTTFKMRHWRSPDARRLNYFEHVLGSDTHVKEVKLFNLAPFLLKRYRALAEVLFAEDRKLALHRTGWSYGLSLVGTTTFYGCYALIAIGAAAGRITLGNLTLYVSAFRQGQQAFQGILASIGGMYEHNLYMSNLFKFLAIEGTDSVGSRVTTPLSPSEQGIRFDDVSFQYPGQERMALDGVSLFIPKGQSLALVGTNGAGKTTFIKLLTRLYHPTHGRVLIDGCDVQEWNPEALRQRVGVIFQDFNRYQFTVRENVGVGSMDHESDEARILRALDNAGATELVQKLPLGLDTTLGRWFLQDGTELSGGQWQAIALARAYMREEADILVLDEPTAALDAEAEYAVFQRFRDLTVGRTTIVISHRFPTVRMASRIVVLDAGRIVEDGSHAELLGASGLYARLFSIQAQGYR